MKEGLIKVGDTINTQELIKISESNGVKAVSAKELYLKLGYDKSQWSRWYNANIVNNDYALEGVDFQTLDIMSNGNLTKDFAITIDFAKELCMLARNENGKKIRLYFIECEKLAKTKFEIPQTYAQALMLAAKQAEQIEEQQKVIEAQAPKVEYFDALVDRKLNVNFRDTAKEFGIKGSELIRELIERKYIYRDAKKCLKPYAQYVDELFVIKEYTNHSGYAGTQTLITPRGRETFKLLIKL